MYLKLAQKYLIKTRAASGKTKLYFANLCLVCLAKQGISPEEIGTTRQELSAIQNQIVNFKKQKQSQYIQQVPIETCKKYLRQCRKAQGASRQYYANLCLSYLTKYAINPVEIGLYSGELRGLQNKGFLESAINYLEEARKAIGTRKKCYTDLCWDYLGKAKATPEEIGSSEEELNKMNV